MSITVDASMDTSATVDPTVSSCSRTSESNIKEEKEILSERGLMMGASSITATIKLDCNGISEPNTEAEIKFCGKESSIENSKVSNLITKEMLAEECDLEEKAISEEMKQKEKMLEEERKMSKELRKEEEEKCFKRLRLLLSRSSIYAQFMFDKIKIQEKKLKKLENGKSEKDLNNTSTGMKRKLEDSKAAKKFKSDVILLDVFKRENMANMNFDEDKSSDKAAYDKQILESQPNLFYGGVMRPYQLEGFDWLKTLYENGVNGILADEMGLGKTIQTIAFIAHLVEMGISGPFFVCAPLSTLPNWYSEFQRFTPDLPVILYHGTKDDRMELAKHICKKAKVKDFYSYPVIITSYSIALNDAKLFKRVTWKMLVVDEAHRIKNFQCKLIQTLKQFNAVHRLLLTGTPLQNDLTELWSLLNFILPEIFQDLEVFESWFDINRLVQNGGTMEIIAREQEKQIVSTIHQILTPFLLRRTKCDVELNLPSKKEVIVHAPMTPLQQEYYYAAINHVIRKDLNAESKKGFDKAVNLPKRVSKKTSFFGCEPDSVNGTDACPQVVTSDGDNPMAEIHLKLGNIVMCLRKVCCHPYLISYPLDCAGEYLVDENLVKSSGKLLVLDCLLAELKKRGHRVLLFSQFVSMLQILQDYCRLRNYKFCYLSGNCDLQDRQKQIKEFNEDESILIFLISTRAGGLGINLTGADTVIVYDSDWNPQSDLQAQDRCHRIGQAKPVVVYRLVVPNTIDEKVVDRATVKRKLEKVIMRKGRFASKYNIAKAPSIISKEELLELMDSSDIEGFVKTDTNCVISPEELEKILDRSTMI